MVGSHLALAVEVPGGDLTPEARLPYVQTAAASDLFEIQSGQLAAQRAQFEAYQASFEGGDS